MGRFILIHMAVDNVDNYFFQQATIRPESFAQTKSWSEKMPNRGNDRLMLVRF